MTLEIIPIRIGTANIGDLGNLIDGIEFYENSRGKIYCDWCPPLPQDKAAEFIKAYQHSHRYTDPALRKIESTATGIKVTMTALTDTNTPSLMLFFRPDRNKEYAAAYCGPIPYKNYLFDMLAGHGEYTFDDLVRFHQWSDGRKVLGRGFLQADKTWSVLPLLKWDRKGNLSSFGNFPEDDYMNEALPQAQWEAHTSGSERAKLDPDVLGPLLQKAPAYHCMILYAENRDLITGEVLRTPDNLPQAVWDVEKTHGVGARIRGLFGLRR